MANVSYINVTNPEQMQMEITRLVSAGFMVANQNNRSVTLVKRKQFSVPMLVIGLVLCLLPMIIYLIVYACQSDQIVEIRLIDRPQQQAYRASDHVPIAGDPVVTPPPINAPVVQLTPDGSQWWDGAEWQSTATSYPPHAARSQDGGQWWDGQSWRSVPRS